MDMESLNNKLSQLWSTQYHLTMPRTNAFIQKVSFESSVNVPTIIFCVTCIVGLNHYVEILGWDIGMGG